MSKSSVLKKHDRFLRGRQIACMMYGYFRVTGSYYAVLGLSDLFASTLDGIMLFSVSEMPSDMILEVFYM